MNSIAENIAALQSGLPDGVTLVAVSKFHPVEALIQAYDAGQRHFGESRAAEMVEKAKSLPKDIHWHFIGHLQTNKVRQIVPYVSLIHSIDTVRLLKLVSDEACRAGRVIDVLLQAHVADEDTKTGFMPDELLQLAAGYDNAVFPGVRICGIMGMATNTDNEERIVADFKLLKELFDHVRNTPAGADGRFSVLSMGMSHDYPMALQCGANMVRIGSMIFGERQY